jgi:hypothetical protein
MVVYFSNHIIFQIWLPDLKIARRKHNWIEKAKRIRDLNEVVEG